MVWSDETKINRIGSDGRKWVWKRAGEQLSPRLVKETVKFGGGHLMFWGCMTWEGVGYGCNIEGKMDADLYVKIMEDELQRSMRYWKTNWQKKIFQQDNDPKHTSKKAQTWFKNHKIPVMVWPAQSPDLNLIEHLWSHVKRKLGEYETEPAWLDELWIRLQKEWDEIPVDVVRNLIESMPRRVQAVLKAKGGHTKY